jgi:phenylacetate-CoA ligase
VFSTFSQDTGTWERIYHAALRFRPAFVVGYVSSLGEFAKFLIESKRTLSGVQAVIAAAEPVFESTREAVSSAFGAPLFNTYGSREFMSIAAECAEHRGLHLNAENLFVETESSNGNPGEVLVTDLHNYGMPFLRYRIGDVAVLDQSAHCVCGRSLPLIRSIEGRVLDVIRTKSGRVVPGEVFPHVLKEIPEIREFQVKQESIDELVLSVVLAQELSSRGADLIRSEIESHFHGEMKLTIRRANRIERTPSGKRRIIVGLDPRGDQVIPTTARS